MKMEENGPFRSTHVVISHISCIIDIDKLESQFKMRNGEDKRKSKEKEKENTHQVRTTDAYNHSPKLTTCSPCSTMISAQSTFSGWPTVINCCVCRSYTICSTCRIVVALRPRPSFSMFDIRSIANIFWSPDDVAVPAMKRGKMMNRRSNRPVLTMLSATCKITVAWCLIISSDALPGAMRCPGHMLVYE